MPIEKSYKQMMSSKRLILVQFYKKIRRSSQNLQNNFQMILQDKKIELNLQMFRIIVKYLIKVIKLPNADYCLLKP